MKMTKFFATLTMFAVMTGFAACGGGDDEGTETPPPAPALPNEPETPETPETGLENYPTVLFLQMVSHWLLHTSLWKSATLQL